MPNGWSSEQKLKILVICTTVRRNFARRSVLVVLESGTYRDLITDVSWLGGQHLVVALSLVLFVGQVTLAFFLALVRQDRAVEVVESPPLATELERLGPATSKSEVPAQS